MPPIGAPTETPTDTPTETPTEVPNKPADPGIPDLTMVLGGVEADSIQYYACKYSGNFAVIEKDGKFGIIGYDGGMLLPIEYDRIYQGGTYDYYYLTASKNGTSYIINSNGQLEENPGYGGGDVDPVMYWHENEYVCHVYGFGIVRKSDANSEWYFDFDPMIDQRAWRRGAVLPVQQLAGVTEQMPYHPIINNPLYGLVERDAGVMVTGFVYEAFDDHNGFSGGVLAVKKDGKWGYVNEKGECVVDYLYDSCKSDSYDWNIYGAVNGYITVTRNGLWGLIDTNGNVIVDIAYEGISQVNPDGLVWLCQAGIWSLYRIGG